jgi:beta-galactosidase
MWPLKHTKYLVTEANAQSTDWSSAFQYPPFDGQLREGVYTHLSNGADLVEYWHWASIAANQEVYWKGCSRWIWTLTGLCGVGLDGA